MGTNTMALIQTHQIQAIMTVPHRLSFSAQLSNCSVGTCWHSELSILGLIHLSISIHFSNSFTCSMKIFLGLALGASCVACATTEKHSCPQRHASVGKLSLGKPAKITFGENKDVNSSIKFSCRLYNNSLASASGGACAMGTISMALIQTCQIQAIMTVPERLSFSAQLTNCNVGPCWHGMANIGACWHSAFSTTTILQWFYQVLSFENSPWASLGRIQVHNHRKRSCPQRHASVGKLSLGKPATITFGENKL